MQTYRYDIMAKGDSDWLRQVADDIVLNSYFNHIIQNPAVVNSLLKDKHKPALLSKCSTEIVCVCVCQGKGSSYLEQGVVLEECADYFAGVFHSIF